MLIGVVDLETTGLNPYRHHRIVEVAALVVSDTGEIVREFTTLIDPERDIGPTSIHGLLSADVLGAPRFFEIAGELIDVLDGCTAISGHNVRFDLSFLNIEFEKAGHVFPLVPTICTMCLAGGMSLSGCCEVYGIARPAAHSAHDDAWATAELLGLLLPDAPFSIGSLRQQGPIKWPSIPKLPARCVTRTQSRLRQECDSYLGRIMERVQQHVPTFMDDVAVMQYTALLERALEDRNIENHEEQALIDVALHWGLTRTDVENAHQDYLRRLAVAATLDGTVTDAERRDLCLVARLLGLGDTDLDQLLEAAFQQHGNSPIDHANSFPLTSREHFVGKRVCFTGELQCLYRGTRITKELAVSLAQQQGVEVAESVTKKLDILVVADPHTQSGKARKARQYGIRILHEPVFWSAIGVEFE